MTKRLVLVAGNIASGKTSLTERLGSRLGWRTAFESVADNPYLAEFYADMRQWSFHLQVFFLGHRAEQHLELANGSAVGHCRPQHLRGRVTSSPGPCTIWAT